VSFSGLDDGGADAAGTDAPGTDAAVDAHDGPSSTESGLPGDGGAPGEAAPVDASLGCYADFSTKRDLPFGAYDSMSNTIEACITACTYHGYRYAGAQDGIQCFCGNSYGGYGPSAGCTTPCPGNTAETCGGPYANSVYRTTVPLDAGVD
jgi:hypothetical protein